MEWPVPEFLPVKWFALNWCVSDEHVRNGIKAGWLVTKDLRVSVTETEEAIHVRPVLKTESSMSYVALGKELVGWIGRTVPKRVAKQSDEKQN